MIVSPFRLPKISCASRTPLATPTAWQDISEGQVPSAGRRPGNGDPHEWAPYSGRQESPPCQLQTNRTAWDAAADLIEPGRCPTFLAPRWGARLIRVLLPGRRPPPPWRATAGLPFAGLPPRPWRGLFGVNPPGGSVCIEHAVNDRRPCTQKQQRRS